MVGVYILFSAKLDQYYTGFSKHPQRRLQQHRRGASAWTSRAEDWVLVYQSRLESMAEGRALEKRIKARGARRFLEEQLPNPAEAGPG
jgi:putative endonuclease